jgi:dihydroxyacetone kinase-like protein
MSASITKLINDPEHIAPELLEGVVAAYHGKVRQLKEPGALVKTRLRQDKVGLVIGGVCGHEPLFSMLIGDNLADGAASGTVYCVPDPQVIVATTQAVDQGLGVLYVYGNWRSNIDRFTRAEKLVTEAGIETRTVRVWDDVASAPADQIEQRAGISGDMVVMKVAGAATAQAKSLEEAYTITARARDNTRSIAVVLATGTIPATGEPLYKLSEGEVEIGSKLHGQGTMINREAIQADPVVEAMMDELLAEDVFAEGDDVYLLINNLGSATYLEMLIANRKVRHILRDRNISVHQTVIGSYFTCQETAGLCITMMRLDEELRRCVDTPADSLGFSTMGPARW